MLPNCLTPDHQTNFARRVAKSVSWVSNFSESVNTIPLPLIPITAEVQSLRTWGFSSHWQHLTANLVARTRSIGEGYPTISTHIAWVFAGRWGLGGGRGGTSLLDVARHSGTSFKTTFRLFPNDVRNYFGRISFFTRLFISQENLAHAVFAAVKCKTSLEMVDVRLQLIECDAFLWCINCDRTNT